MNFEALKAKIDKVPKNAGTKDQPHLFHIGPGSQKKSIIFHLQYGKSSERRKMKVRECNSSGLILECSHEGSKLKCKAKVKLQVLDPKMLNKKVVIKGGRPRFAYELNLENEDIMNEVKYRVLSATAAHSEHCPKEKKYGTVCADFRHQNGKESVDKATNMTMINAIKMLSAFDDCSQELARKAGFSERREMYSAASKMKNSKDHWKTTFSGELFL